MPFLPRFEFLPPNLRNLSVLVVIISTLYQHLTNENAWTNRGSSFNSSSVTNLSNSLNFDTNDSTLLLTQFASFSDDSEDEERGEVGGFGPCRLEYDFYSGSCLQVERIVQEAARDKHRVNISCVAPALLRLVLPDCFIEGCDASILLDGMEPEKDSPPNQGLKGFDIIDIIKSELENACPLVVNCADIVVLAAREAVVQGGGPFYPLYTGRRDGNRSYCDIATHELPSPYADLPKTLAVFASRGFDHTETVSLLGAHSIGIIHCKFFKTVYTTLVGLKKPDTLLDPDFLTLLRSRYPNASIAALTLAPLNTPPSPAPFLSSISPSSSTTPTPPFIGSPSPSSEKQLTRPLVTSSAAPLHSFIGFQTSSKSKAPVGALYDSILSSKVEPGMDMAYMGSGVDFGTAYYYSLLQSKGLLHSDQQLMAGEESCLWIQAYTSDISLICRDFANEMIKLSNHGVLTGSSGQIQHNCSKVE